MALISISGIGRKKAKPTKAQKKVAVKKTIAQKKAIAQKKVAVKKEKVKVAKKQILTKIKKVGKVVVKYNPLVATARNSFLVLVSLNVFNLAKRLNMMLVKNPKKLLDFWKGLSGNFASLQSAINTGKNKKAIVGAVAVASAIATATPILVKVMKFLEENGISKEDIKKAVNTVVAKAIDKKITKEAVKQVEEEEKEEAPEEETETTSEEAPEEATETISEEAPEEAPEEATEEGQMGYYC
jgi:hypothetical protein